MMAVPTLPSKIRNGACGRSVLLDRLRAGAGARSLRRRSALPGAPSGRAQLALDPRSGVRRSDGLGFRRAALAKEDGERGERADGKELRLPVLERVLPEVRAADVCEPRDGRLVMGLLLRVELGPPGYGLGEPRPQEDGRHQDEQRVRVDRGP